MCQIRLFSSDLDYTFLHPQNGIDRKNIAILMGWLSKNKVKVAYVTGRNFESVIKLSIEHDFPMADYVISDVGTVIHYKNGKDWVEFDDWNDNLSNHWSENILEKISLLMKLIDNSILQPEICQGKFKLSYFINDNSNKIPDYRKLILREIKKNKLNVNLIISGSDENQMLVDFLPVVASKSKALEFLINKLQIQKENVVFCGDSGNDRDALLSGVYGILVRTNDSELKADLSSNPKIYISEYPDMKGIVDGLRHFKFMGD